MVAEGYGKGIGGIEVPGLFFNGKYALQHFPDLVFIGITVTGNGLFYFLGRLFRYRHIGLHGCGNGHTLRPSEFKHTLYILPEERGFNGKRRGAV